MLADGVVGGWLCSVDYSMLTDGMVGFSRTPPPTPGGILSVVLTVIDRATMLLLLGDLCLSVWGDEVLSVGLDLGGF